MGGRHRISHRLLIMQLDSTIVRANVTEYQTEWAIGFSGICTQGLPTAHFRKTSPLHMSQSPCYQDLGLVPCSATHRFHAFLQII